MSTNLNIDIFVKNVKNNLNDYLRNFVKAKDLVEENEAKLTNENSLVNLVVSVQYPDLDDNVFTFDEWLKNVTPNLITEEGTFTDINTISSYSFGLLVSNLIKAEVLSVTLLELVLEVNKACFSFKKKPIITPLLYKEEENIVVGLSYMLESDNKTAVLLVIEITKLN